MRAGGAPGLEHSRRAIAVAAAVTIAAAIAAAPAPAADLTAPVLISGSPTLQADYAYQTAVSAGGGYGVFTGSVGGVPGIYRKDLRTGELDLVAAGDAAAPSINGDGRYISFTTDELDPATGAGQGQQCSSVYVRDMSLPIGAAAAFTLASALDGSTDGLTYAGTGDAGCPGGGSSAAAGVALSSDGSDVVFTVVGASNLTTGQGGSPTTPRAQVVVRDMATDKTTLVSQTQSSLGLAPQPVPDGGAMTDLSTAGSSQVPPGNADPGDSTAAISADGTTVAWLGINIPSQAPADASDAPAGYPNQYDEPLWRRIADGSSAPTRRILGGDDEAGPCSAGCTGPLDLQYEPDSSGGDAGPEHGSLINAAGFLGATPAVPATLTQGIPALSADGMTVAVLSTAPLTGQDPPPASPTTANAYVVNMAPGLSRSQALTTLTRWASNNFRDAAADGPLTAIAISPQADQVAFVTSRTEFPLSPPAFIGPTLSALSSPQLYLVDISDGTFQLASYGFDGQPANVPSNGSVASVETPSFSYDGGPLAFASAATNLVFGAESDLFSFGVPVGTEAFTISQLVPTRAPGVTSISALPANARFKPEWRLSARARQNGDGSVRLDVRIPGAGVTRAVARCTLLELRLLQHRPTKRLRRHHDVAMRQLRLASASRRSAKAGIVTLKLSLAAQYRKLTANANGLYAMVTVTFAAPGHHSVSQMLPVDFRRPADHRRRTARPNQRSAKR
jgi:Tol biopolymer transport system component